MLRLIQKRTLFLAVIALFIMPLATSVLFVLPKVKAQSLVFSACSLKINKDTCNKEVEAECTSSDPAALERCAKGKARKYTTVYKVCRSKEDPQACHNKVKESCKGKTGSSRTKCQKTAAKKFTNGAPVQAASNAFNYAYKAQPKNQCGEGEDAVETRIDFGCQGEGGPIEDLAYALIRFLSFGVGLVIVASIIYAGIQYSSSEGSPEATQAAKKRIQNAIVGLIFYIFIFALVQYLVPGGLFSQ